MYLVAFSDNFTAYTDHMNFLFISYPTAVGPSLDRHKVLKTIRWALYLSVFSYPIEHIPGKLNTMVGKITWWFRVFRAKINSMNMSHVCAPRKYTKLLHRPQQIKYRGLLVIIFEIFVCCGDVPFNTLSRVRCFNAAKNKNLGASKCWQTESCSWLLLMPDKWDITAL